MPVGLWFAPAGQINGLACYKHGVYAYSLVYDLRLFRSLHHDGSASTTLARLTGPALALAFMLLLPQPDEFKELERCHIGNLI